MKLSDFDDKRIRLITISNEVFEGNCTYNNIDYNEHEYGRREESLVMSNIMFFKRDIKLVSVIKNYTDENYGKLEEDVLEDGILLIDEVLTSEDNEAIIRLLKCIEDNLDKEYEEENFFEKLLKLLNDIIKYNEDEEVKNETNRLIEMINEKNKE